MRATALDIHKIIKAAGYGIEYALDLSEGGKKPDDLRKLSSRQKNELNKMTSPAVREIIIGPQKNSLAIGGEEVLYRHELRFMNQTAVFIEVDDLMGPAELRKRTSFVKDFFVERIGHKLRLDGISIRFRSHNPYRFKKTVESVKKEWSGPIIISVPKTKDIEPVIHIIKKMRPLIRLEKEDASKAIGFAEKNDLSLVLPKDDPMSLAKKSRGFDGFVFDASSRDLKKTLRNQTVIRESAVKGRRELGYPLISFLSEEDPYEESLLACTLISRYASILVLRAIEPYALLPVLTHRQGLYSDPRIQPRVEPGIYSIGEPNKDSPLIMTSNFALTYHSVLGDLEKAKVSCYLLALETDGLAVTVSLAADKMNAKAVKDALERYKAEEKTPNRKLIIPGFASRLAEGIKDETGWEVLVGPNDSSQLPDFLKNL